MSYKKYILFFLCIFSLEQLFPISLSQGCIENLYSATKDITWKKAVGVLMIIGSIRLALWVANKLLAHKVFVKEYNDQIRSCEFSKNTLIYVEKHPRILYVILKLFLFINHTSTQNHYVSYIKAICQAKKYKEMQPIVLFLLSCGINPRFSESYDQGLLARACFNEDSIELVKYLLETLKLDPNDKDRKTKYESIGYAEYGPCIEDAADPLSVACYRNNTQAVKLLMKHNTQTHPCLDLDPMGGSPIEWAINHNNTEMFRDLFLYTMRKTSPTFIIRKVCMLEQIMKIMGNEDMQKVILHAFIDLTIKKPDKYLIDSCFVCDEKVWLPHNKNNLYSGRIRVPHRMEENAPITANDWWYTIDLKKRDNKLIPEIKKKVKKFLPTCQITS